MAQEHEDLEERMLHRMLFFTDAVFAIVLTLMALELRPPETAAEATPEYLREMAGQLWAFTVSFFLIGIFWTAHMNTTRRLARFDWPTALANILYMFPICLLPFASGWFGVSLNGAFSWAVYCWLLVATSVGNMFLVLVAYRGGGRLIAGTPMKGEGPYRLLRAAAPGIAFGMGLVGLALDRVILAHFCWVFIPLVFWLAGVAFKPKPVAAAAEATA